MKQYHIGKRYQKQGPLIEYGPGRRTAADGKHRNINRNQRPHKIKKAQNRIRHDSRGSKERAGQNPNRESKRRPHAVYGAIYGF